MCVIIITNPDNPINETELKEAWETNPDGAGLAYVESGQVVFKRGFMNRDYYIKEVQALQDKRPLMLHLRISTGAGINPQGTHPYKAGNVLAMQGTTSQPVICMNGVIYGQKLETKQGNKLNDTASYIKNHSQAFQVINQDILDIIASDTGSKWSAATPNGIIWSDNFQEYQGRQYSNLNHINRWTGYISQGLDDLDIRDWLELYDSYDYTKPARPEPDISERLKINHLLPDKLINQLKKDKALYEDTLEYIWQHCNYYDCKYCNDCLADCFTVQDIRDMLAGNTNIWELIQEDE